jgi:hypothetical protein
VETHENWLGTVRVNVTKVLVWTLPSLIAACGEIRHGTPSIALPGPAVHQSPKSPEERLLKLRAGEYGFTQFGPEDRLFARIALDQYGHPNLLVYDLLEPDSLPKLVPSMGEFTEMKFISVHRIINFDAQSGRTRLADLETGQVAETWGRAMPVMASKEFVSVDRDGHFVFLDSATLATIYSLASPMVPAACRSLILRLDASGLVVTVIDDACKEAFVIDPDKRVLRFHQTESETLTISHSGKYLAYAKPLSDNSLRELDWEIGIVEIVTGARIFSNIERFSPDLVKLSLAFSHDEKLAAYSVSPAFMTLVSLPSGKKTRHRTGQGSANSIGYPYYTQHLAFAGDDSFLCGHPASTLPHDTDCLQFVYADFRQKPSSRDLSYCAIQGNTSFPLPRNLYLTPKGRVLESRLCDEALSPDHRYFTLVTARAPIEDGIQVFRDREIRVVDFETREVRLRSSLDPGGQASSVTYSPKGHWVVVGDNNAWKTLDLTRLRECTLQSWPISFSPAEEFGVYESNGSVSITRLTDGTTRVFPQEIGNFCLADGNLLPLSACPSLH